MTDNDVGLYTTPWGAIFNGRPPVLTQQQLAERQKALFESDPQNRKIIDLLNRPDFTQQRGKV